MLDHNKPYIQITRVGAYSFSGRTYKYDGIIVTAGQIWPSQKAEMVGWTNKNYVSENVNFTPFPDTQGAILDGGTTATFYFSNTRIGKSITITNNIFDQYYTNEYGDDVIDAQITSNFMEGRTYYSR